VGYFLSPLRGCCGLSHDIQLRIVIAGDADLGLDAEENGGNVHVTRIARIFTKGRAKEWGSEFVFCPFDSRLISEP
jgi:hypothetical protein